MADAWADMAVIGSAVPRQLSLVGFFSGGQRYAVEASRVLEKQAHGGSPSGLARLLVRLDGQETRVLEVSEPVELLIIPDRHVHALPPLIASQNPLPGLRALAFDERGMLLILEPR